MGASPAELCACLSAHASSPSPLAPLGTQTLSTGRYRLVDVCCRSCCAVLGWRYVAAEAADQRYKEGTSLVNRALVTRVLAARQAEAASSPASSPPRVPLAQLARLAQAPHTPS